MKSPKKRKMKGGGCGSDPPINARTHQGALPAAVFEQHARPIMESSGVVPSPVPDHGNCCFVAINITVFGDDSYERMCQTRRDITSFIQNDFDEAKAPWSDLPSPASKEYLIKQHHFCKERVGEEHHGDENTIHIFAFLQRLKFLVLMVHELSHETFGGDKLAVGDDVRHFLIFDSKIKHWSATVQGAFSKNTDVIYFSNPHCNDYGFLDAFSVVPDQCRIRYQSKRRDFLGLFNSVEQLYSFMMAELFSDWDRADEILKSDSPFEAANLCKTVRIYSIDAVTGEVSTARYAFDTEEWWQSAPSVMADALTAKFYGNEALTARLLATFPKPLAKASQSDLRWGIGLSSTEATLGMKWRGTNLSGHALMKLRGHLLHTRAAAPCTGNYSTMSSEGPSNAEVVNSTLIAVDPYNPQPASLAGRTMRDGDIHRAAQMFMPQSNEQQAALFGMNVMGSILPTEEMGAPLAHVKDVLLASKVYFAGEKRARGSSGAEPDNTKKPASGFTGVAPCVTCVQCRSDDCTVCGTCCACCVCLPRKQFVSTHAYSGSAAEDQMSSVQLEQEAKAAVPAGAAAEGVVTVPVAMELDEPGGDPVVVKGAGAEDVPTQYIQCDHGFVLIQGTVDDTLQPQCTLPHCVMKAVVPPEAAAFAATVQQPRDAVVPIAGSLVAVDVEPSASVDKLKQRRDHLRKLLALSAKTPSSHAADPGAASLQADAGVPKSAVSGVDDVFYEAKESPHQHDGYTCPDCGSEFLNEDDVLEHDCPASGNTAVHPPPEDEQLCLYQVVYGQLANGAPTCNVGVRPIAVNGILVSGHTDLSVPHYSSSPDGVDIDPNHVVCARCGKFFDLETLLSHCCKLNTITVKHRLPVSGISSPPVSLPLVNNEVAFIHSNPPSQEPVVKVEVDTEVTSDVQEQAHIDTTCRACGSTVDLASLDSCKVGRHVFCGVSCKDHKSADPSYIVLTDENREEAKEIALALAGRLEQVQANVESSDDDEPPDQKAERMEIRDYFEASWNCFEADPPGFLEHITHAKDRHYFSDGILHMVELFAGVGAFGTGWRRLGNTVIGVCEWNESLKDLLIERNPEAVFGTDFNQVNFQAWRSMFDQNSQRVHCTAGGPECTPFSGSGKENGMDDPKSNQITGMADASQSLGSCVCVIENVPNIEDHDFTEVIRYFRSKDYHMVVNQYVEHVMNGGSTMRKRVFPTFEVGQMAAIMPPVDMTNTKLPVFRLIDTPGCPGFDNGINHNSIAKCLMPFDEVPAWLSVHGDYLCDGVMDDADVKHCQRIGVLWFGEHKHRPSIVDLAEGQRVRMDFDQNIWVIFSIEPITGRLKVFKDDRKSPQYRETGKRRQHLTVKNVREIVPHSIPVYSIHYPCLTIRKFRVPPAFNGPLIADDRGVAKGGTVVVRRMSGEELWRLTQLPVDDAELLLASGVEELELGSLAGNSIPASMVQPELCSIDQRVRQFSALVDSSPEFFQWIHVAAPAVDMPVTIDFLVIIRSVEGSNVQVGEECALWCSTLEALPGRVLARADSRDSAVSWGEKVAERILGGFHVGLLAADYSVSKVTIRIVVVPTCEASLALEYNEFEADWIKIQESEGSKVWDIVSVAYAKMTSKGRAPTGASPWIKAAAGEDQV